MPGTSWGTPSLSDIDAQIAALNARGTVGGIDGASRLQTMLGQLGMQRNALLSRGQGPGGMNGAGDPGLDRVNQARTSMYDLAKGRLSDLKSDPLDAQISQQLQGMMSGSTAPYDANTVNALITGQTDRNATAAGNQYQQTVQDYASNGGNAFDPALLAEKRGLERNRMQANQGVNLDVNQRANVANYNARAGATMNSAAFNANRNQAITNQGHYLGGLYQQEYATHETPISFGAWSGSQQQPNVNNGYTGPASYSGGPAPWGQGDSTTPSSVWAGSGRSNPEPVYYGNSARNFGSSYTPGATPATMTTAAPPQQLNPLWAMPQQPRQPQNIGTQRQRQINPQEMY